MSIMAKEINFEELPIEFIELYENSDDWIGKPLTLHQLARDIRDRNYKVIECYLHYKAEYSAALRTFTVQMAATVKDIKNYFDALKGANQGQFAYYGQWFRNSWQIIIGKISRYPEQLENYLKRKKFVLADRLMDQSKKIIEFYDVKYTYNLNDLKTYLPKQAEKVASLVQPLRQEIIEKTMEIGNKIKQCARENNF